MARHRDHRSYDRRSFYTADSLQTSFRARSVSPKHNYRRHNRHADHRNYTSSPEDSRRSLSVPRNPRHRRRRDSPPSRRRSRHRGRRRHSSWDSIEPTHRRRVSPSPARRQHHAHKPEPRSKGRFTQQLLKLLATSVTPRRPAPKKLDELPHLWNPNFYIPDASPLIQAEEMPRHSPHLHPHHHVSHFRAREEIESERLRKMREEAAAAERRRDEAEEEARRVRRQQELDEAELRRQRLALTQIDEQRRESNLEDRLRQLEEQELEFERDNTKPPKAKSCCRTMKIFFGIGLVLGLVLVFLLIVASIIGHPTPFDIFSHNASSDPFLVDDNDNIVVPSFTFPTTTMTTLLETSEHSVEKEDDQFTEYPESYENNGSADVNTNDYDVTYSNTHSHPVEDADESESRVNYNKNYGYYDTPRDFGEVIILEDTVGKSDGGSDSSSKDVYTHFELPPQYGDSYHSVLDVDNSEYNPTLISNHNGMHFSDDGHFHENSNKFNHFHTELDSSGEESVAQSNYETFQIKNPSFEVFEKDRSSLVTKSPYDFLIPTVQVSNNNEYREVSSERAGYPFRPIVRDRQYHTSKPSEVFSEEIAKTIREISNKNQMGGNRRRVISSTYLSEGISQGPQYNRRSRPSSPRMPASFSSTRPRIPLRSIYPVLQASSSRTKALTPESTRRLRANRSRDRGVSSSPSRRTNNRREYYQQGASTNQRNYRSHLRERRRGPRTTEYHRAPAEFRYPSNANSIQDIIEYMTNEESTSHESESRSSVPTSFKVGNQDHVLSPEYVRHDEVLSEIKKDARFNKNVHKGERGVLYRDFRNRGRRRYSRRPPPGPKNRIKPNPHDIHIDEDVVFDDDGNLYHMSEEKNQHKPNLYEHTPKSTEDEYLPPYFQTEKASSGSKDSSFKLMLDVFPLIKTDKRGKKVVRYESKYTFVDLDKSNKVSSKKDYDDYNYYTDQMDREYPNGKYATSDPSYNSGEPNYDVDHSTYYSDDGASDENIKIKPFTNGHSFKNRDRYPTRYRDLFYKKQHERLRPSYNDKNQDNQQYKPNIHEDYSYDSRYPDKNSDKSHEGNYPSTFDKGNIQHNAIPPIHVMPDVDKNTITLHINLYSKKPDYDVRATRRGSMEKEEIEKQLAKDREVSLEVPLTKQFSLMDVFMALMKYVHTKNEKPTAQQLVANGVRRSDGSSDGSSIMTLEDSDSQSSLLEALDQSIRDMNKRLPQSVQLEVLSYDNEEDKQRLMKEKVGTPANDFHFSEGFKVAYMNEPMTGSASTHATVSQLPAYSRLASDRTPRVLQNGTDVAETKNNLQIGTDTKSNSTPTIKLTPIKQPSPETDIK